MVKAPDWAPFLEAGMEFTEMTRTEARRRARRLVKEGQLAQDRAQAFVDEMVESSRRRADELLSVVRTEFQRQVDSLGLATKEDLAALEDKLGHDDTSTKKRKHKKKHDKLSKGPGKKDKKSKHKKNSDTVSKDATEKKEKVQKASQGQASLAQVKAAKKVKRATKANKAGPSKATVRRNAARKAGASRKTASATKRASTGKPAAAGKGASTGKAAAKRPGASKRTPRSSGEPGTPPGGPPG